MLHWKKSILPPSATLTDVMANLNETGARIVNIVDDDNQLLGIITDGDLRRALLRGCGMKALAQSIMRKDFTYAGPNDTNAQIAQTMQAKSLLQIPVLDTAGRILEIKFLTDVLKSPARENWVLLMAGGLGTRLLPLTKNTPKPLLPVGGKPVLENILKSFQAQGFEKFFIAVNYLAEQIENYFGDGSKLGVQITYLHEKERMGTAGALSLLPELPGAPMLVMNADVLTRLNYAAMLEFHELNNAVATMGVREYKQEVPYGVIKTEGNRLMGIVEKPVQQYFVNAGVYTLSPAAIQALPEHCGFFDMPELFLRLMEQNLSTAAYPIRDYWLDIGRPEDLERANQEYSKIFKD